MFKEIAIDEGTLLMQMFILSLFPLGVCSDKRVMKHVCRGTVALYNKVSMCHINFCCRENTSLMVMIKMMV